MGNKLSLIKQLQKNNNISRQGRWVVKNKKQTDISEYWSNIDHCGDKVCGNLEETKQFYEKDILKIKK